MSDLNPIERRLIDWLSRQSDLFLVSLPIAVFLALALFGVLLISVFAGQSVFNDPAIIWLSVATGVAALGLYLTTIEVMGVAFIRSRRFKLLELHQTMRDIQAMSWRDFEDLVGAYFQAKGYAVEPRSGDAPDGGNDLIVRKGNSRWIVQCKQYRNQLVDVRRLRELLGVVTADGATGGIFVACGGYEERALAFAKATDKLELIGGEQLSELVQSAVRGKNPDIKCPTCGSAMRETTGKYGPFLGCTNFPACHGWLPIRSDARAS